MNGAPQILDRAPETSSVQVRVNLVTSFLPEDLELLVNAAIASRGGEVASFSCLTLGGNLEAAVTFHAPSAMAAGETVDLLSDLGALSLAI